MIPVIFVGHGSPMNAIENNEFTEGWRKIGEDIPKPKVILCISAHWETNGTKVSTLEHPKTIHDFYGFPKELFDVEYKVEGSPELAAKTLEILGDGAVGDNTWGIDHGAWSVLRIMYPEGDIPVYQMSIDWNATLEEIYGIGRKLSALRNQGVLIMGSGNVVHNLRVFDFDIDGGYDWAETFDDYIAKNVITRDVESILNYKCLGETASLAVPTGEHFKPLVYILGAVKDSDEVELYNKACVAGSISMTSYVFR